MNHLYKLPTPTIFGHRGACAHAPENTLAAFRLAFEQGADAIELDAKLSADGEVMVIHDPKVDRTTNGKGWVNSMPCAELRELDAGSFFSEKYRGEKIPMLREVLEEFGKSHYINIELTNYTSPYDSLVEKTAELVNEMDLGERILFSSFSANNLTKAKKLVPNAETGMLALRGLAGFYARNLAGRRVAPHAVHPYLSDATPQSIRTAHDQKRKVHVWTVNHAQDIQNLFNWGVDGLFTDNPALALELRNQLALH
jgi:glycerophosphoryl diester phosphodiesterase